MPEVMKQKEVVVSSSEHLFIKSILWPILLVISIAVAAWGDTQGQVILYFNIAYLLLVVALYFLEKCFPHERQWLEPDGQNMAALLHTLTSKGTVQILFAVSAAIGASQYIVPAAENTSALWPTTWPVWGQVILGMVMAEFALYWMHRLGHEVELIWRFHSIHHAVTKLWFFNTGRFHFVDSILSISAVVFLAIIFGAPMEVFQWVSMLTAFFGILTHCNVDMRCGWLNYIFNTPELHRWHHSKELHEGNRNYGENLMLWDHIFGSWYHADYRPPKDIGIKEASPKSFINQLLWPFLTDAARKRIVTDYVPIPFETERSMVLKQATEKNN